MEEKLLKILLNIGMDKASLEKAVAGFDKIFGSIRELEKEANALREKIKAALAQDKDAKGLSAELEKVNLSIVALKKSANDTLSAGFVSAEEAARRLNDEIDKTDHKLGQSAYNLRDVGEKLNQIGMGLQNAGNSIVNPIMSAANAYLQTASVYDASAMRWNSAQKEMQDSYARIGGIAVKSLLPLIESTAKLTEQIADLLEKHPGLINTALLIGGVLKAGGMALQAYGQYKIMQGTTQSLTGSTLGAISKTAGTAAIGALGTPLGAAGAIAVGGTAIYGTAAMVSGNAFNRMIGQKEQTINDVIQSGQAALGILAFGLTRSSEMFGLTSRETSDSLFQTAKSLIGLGDAAKDTGGKLKTGINSFAEKNAQLYIDYEKQEADASKQYGEQRKQAEEDAENQRLEIIKNFADRAAQAEVNYRRENSKAESAYLKANAQAEQDYAKQRSDAIAAFNISEKRAREDHNREMQTLEADHNGRVKDLVASRDAYGLEKENENYTKEKSKAESDFSLADARRKQDFAQQMADAEANFQNQRAQRANDYAAQQTERAQAYAAEMASLKKEKDDQLKVLADATTKQLNKLKNAYDLQTQIMQTAFIDRLNIMSSSIQGDTAKFKKYMQDQSTDFEKFLKSKGYIPTPKQGDRANGGTVLDGMTYLVGERGPELFTAPRNGEIVPAGLTADILNPRARGQNGPRNMTLKIESSSLTMTEILYEVDKRFQRYDNGLQSIFAQ